MRRNATTQFAVMVGFWTGALAGGLYPTKALEMASAVTVDEAAFDQTGIKWRFSECRGIYPCMAAMKTRLSCRHDESLLFWSGSGRVAGEYLAIAESDLVRCFGERGNFR
jgi:hypothetical protein